MPSRCFDKIGINGNASVSSNTAVSLTVAMRVVL